MTCSARSRRKWKRWQSNDPDRVGVIGPLLKRLAVEANGQDLVEYALLAAFIALAGLVTLQGIETSLHDAYGNWDRHSQDLWVVPAPK